MRERMRRVARAIAARVRRALYGQLAEEQRQQAAALERLQLVVRRVDARLTPGKVALRRRVPASAAELPAAPSSAVAADAAMPAGPMLDLHACPVCGHDEWTTVSEYNKLLMLQAAIDDAARRYYYSLCHRCGVVFARVRPIGERYRYLFNRFEVVLGRASEEDEIQGGNALRTSARLDEDARTDLRRRLSHGVFVSELSGLRRHDYVPELQQDRIVSSPHIELLGSLLTLKSPRVLELRPRLGAIGAALQRLYGAEVYAMPLFETQQMLIEEAYGIRTAHLLDYEEFSIPYDGCFDLIVANHMFTHAVRPHEFLTALRRRLKPGGHVYLYNESDEAGVLVGGKQLFNNLNAFHFQMFNGESLGRALAACGFVPTFVSHLNGRLLALASAGDGEPPWAPMAKKERQKRLAAYQRARDLAILRLPPNLRHLFRSEWDAVVERAVVAGSADYDERGRLRIVKRT